MTSIRTLADLYGDDPEEREALFEATRRRLDAWRKRTGKTCARCGEAKPVAEFGPRLDAADGLRGVCRACDAERKRISADAGPLPK